MKNSNKEKYACSGYGITFNSTDWWSFGNGSARNVMIFGLDSLSSHADNSKNNFLILGLGPTFRNDGNFGSPQKKLIINLTKVFSLHYSPDYSYLFVKGKEIFKFKAVNKKIFQLDFV